METSTSGQPSSSQATPGERIVRTPGVCGGKPRIAGTRIRVQDVYFWHELEGKCPEEIVRSFPRLSMADIYAALSYFWTFREEILADLDRQQREFEELKRSVPSILDERLKQLGRPDATDDPLSSR